MLEGLRFQHWAPELRDDGLLLLTLDRQGESVNALSQAVLEELGAIVERLAIDPPKGLLIRSGKPSGFIAGADIGEFKNFADDDAAYAAIRHGQKVFDALAALPCPSVALIHGFCMGGGTELALACSYRVASDDESTRIGLPEVKLGIHPGWGGTVRLTQLIPAPKALDLMLTGRALRASQARSLGIVDAVTSVDGLVEAGSRLCRKRPKRALGQRLGAWITRLWPVRQVLAPVVTRQLARKARKAHYPAPYAIVELYRRYGGNPDKMMLAEARSVAKLAGTDTARNLVRVFFLMERLKGLAGGVEHGIRRVHVIGAGVMGGDIAAWCALRGFEVSLQDREAKFVEPAIQRAARLFENKLRNDAKIAQAKARLRADLAGNGIGEADLIIEAIFENLEAKQALWREVEAKARPDALLASNTSSIRIEDLASALQQPNRLFGLHFFNPVAKMPLIEIVRGPAPDSHVEARAAAFAKALDRLPVPVAGTPGFLVNRILMPYLLEAMTLYSEGVPGPVIDQAAKAWGMPMGPIELADQVGLDVAASVGKILAEFLGLALPAGLEGKLEAGKRGRKDGEGFYRYENGKTIRPEVPKDYAPPADLEDRLILPLLNEAVACLHDRVVDDADLLDAGVIFGTGFAPFRGGPIQAIRELGPAKLKAKLEALARAHGPRFDPRPGWDALLEAETGRG